MQVIPSIDTDDISAFSSQIKRLIPYYRRFQIDFADGLFVPFTSVPLSKAISALNEFESISIDLHLMTAGLPPLIETIQNCSIVSRVKTVFIHHKAGPDPKIFSGNFYPFSMGLVLSPEDTVDTIKQTYDLVSLRNIQIMSVNPGPQGSPFLPNMLNKIEQLRLAGYRNKIFLDGGVNKESLRTILTQKNLPDFICPGSFFSHAENVEESVQYLSEVLRPEHSPQSISPTARIDQEPADV